MAPVAGIPAPGPAGQLLSGGVSGSGARSRAPGGLGRLAVTESGAGDDLVVYVHGVIDRGQSFARVAAALAPGCRALWYDRRGYASSTNAPGAPVGVDAHIDDLVAILDGRRAVVVGHSFGGVVATGAAVRAPDNVAALVIYETVMAWTPGWEDRTMRQLLGSADPEDAGLRLMLGARYAGLTPAVRTRLRPQARAFVAEERSTRAGRPPYDVADLRVPLVYGFSDTFRVVAMQEHLRAVVPDVELVTLSGGGHNAHRAAPDAFAGLVRRGLARAGRPS